MSTDPATITTTWLRSRGADCPDLVTFAEEWPRCMPLTAANLRWAARLGLNLDFFAWVYLAEPQRLAYEAAKMPALAAYQADRDRYLAYRAATAEVLIGMLGLEDSRP